MYAVLGGEHIPGSPFRIHVQLLDRLLLAAEKSRLVLVSKDLKTYKAIEFHVTFPANPAKKQSMVLDQHSQSVELKKTVAKDGEEIVLKCVFVPQKVGRYTLIGRLDKYDVCNSPLDVTVEDACTQFAAETKVVFEEEKHYTRTAIRFRVEFPREASEALNIVVTDEGHRTVSFDGREVEEGVWECEVEAMDRPGKYKVDVNMAGVSVQGYNRELVIHDVCSVWAEQCKAEGKVVLCGQVLSTFSSDGSCLGSGGAVPCVGAVSVSAELSSFHGRQRAVYVSICSSPLRVLHR